MLEKSRTLTVDSVCYDLEDSVIPSLKADARSTLQGFLKLPRAEGIKEQCVRINSISSGLGEDDLKALVTPLSVEWSLVCPNDSLWEKLKVPNLNIDTIVVPKVSSASDLNSICDILDGHRRKDIKLLTLIESARAVMDIREICAATPRLSGLLFAAEDLAADLGITRTSNLKEMAFARQTVVTAATAYKLESAIDLVCTNYQDAGENGPLHQECIDGTALGFTGKQVIHPIQIPVVQQAFTISRHRAEWGVKILIANKKAVEQGRGAWTFEGKMIDAPMIAAAKKIVEKARLGGVDVEELKNLHSNVSPQ